MKKKNRYLLIGFVFLLSSLLFAGCDSSDEPVSEAFPEIVEENGDGAEGELPKPEKIDNKTAWQNSGHAASYITNADGENSKCAKCHAPVNFIPSMDDIPESCFTCKFEIDDPPPIILESEWEHIPCKTCHRVDKDEVEPEIAWLSLPALDEYTDVSSPTVLCMQCHVEIDEPGHFEIKVEGAHKDYGCEDCHDSHSNVASCGEAGCHESLDLGEIEIQGHDSDHEMIPCYVCHDGSGLSVTNFEGDWSTVWVSGENNEQYPFVSHNQELSSDCKRCHYAGNEWGLEEIED